VRAGRHHEHHQWPHRRAERLRRPPIRDRARANAATTVLRHQREARRGCTIQLQPQVPAPPVRQESGDYGDLAGSAFHRYAVTNQLTLGLRRDSASLAWTVRLYQSPLGILGAGRRSGAMAPRSGGIGGLFVHRLPSASTSGRSTARHYAQLADLISGYRIRTSQYASGSLFPGPGTLPRRTAATTADGPGQDRQSPAYTRACSARKGSLALNYVRTVEPQAAGWLLSLLFDATHIGGSRSRAPNGSTQALRCRNRCRWARAWVTT
jgi:hypothetical protein